MSILTFELNLLYSLPCSLQLKIIHQIVLHSFNLFIFLIKLERIVVEQA